MFSINFWIIIKLTYVVLIFLLSTKLSMTVVNIVVHVSAHFHPFSNVRQIFNATNSRQGVTRPIWENYVRIIKNVVGKLQRAPQIRFLSHSLRDDHNILGDSPSCCFECVIENLKHHKVHPETSNKNQIDKDLPSPLKYCDKRFLYGKISQPKKCLHWVDLETYRAQNLMTQTCTSEKSKRRCRQFKYLDFSATRRSSLMVTNQQQRKANTHWRREKRKNSRL